jgi:HPt (histidine-containing phosphotransfer) domain-containing protein
MAMSAAVNHAATIAEIERPPAPVLDLVHLSRQTFGDHSLETELLTLFERQAAQFATRLAEPRLPGDASSRADLAHTLTGSARAVGAFAIGVAAESYEAALRSGAPGADALCEKLIAEIGAACAIIAELFERS